MAWTRIDGMFLKNGKIQRAGIYGMALYLSGLIYCNSALTDGFIDEGLIPGLCGDAFQSVGRKSADRLVEIGLWEKMAGGYQVHDFLALNRSKLEIEKLNQTKKLNGSKGGRPRTQHDNLKQTEQVTLRLASGIPMENRNETPNTLIPNTLNPNTLKDIKQPPPDAREELVGLVFKTYEHEIGLITPTIADDMISALDDYPLDWFGEAFKEAARNNKRNWSYALAILKRWKADGFKADSRTKPTSESWQPTRASRRRTPDMGDYVVRRTNEVVIIDDGTEVIDEM